jgi:hypothetical protein
MTFAAIASVLSSTENGNSGGELYVSGPEALEGRNDSIWGEDAEYLTAPLSHLRKALPVRARVVNPCALYEIVTVVGARGFSATLDPRTTELDLISRSVDLARSVDLHFATITWAIDDSGAAPVRLSAAPEEPELRYAWEEVAGALCEDLTA